MHLLQWLLHCCAHTSSLIFLYSAVELYQRSLLPAFEIMEKVSGRDQPLAEYKKINEDVSAAMEARTW